MLLQLGESLAALNFNGLKPENHPTRSPCIEIVALLVRVSYEGNSQFTILLQIMRITNYKS